MLDLRYFVLSLLMNMMNLYRSFSIRLILKRILEEFKRDIISDLVQGIIRPVHDRCIDIYIVDIVDSMGSSMAAMLYPFSVPIPRILEIPLSSASGRGQISTFIRVLRGKIIVEIASQYDPCFSCLH